MMQSLFLVLYVLLTYVILRADCLPPAVGFAANCHLVVSYDPVYRCVPDFFNKCLYQQSANESLLHHCCSSSSNNIISTKFQRTFYSLAIGKAQNESQLYFIVAGMSGRHPYMSKITVNCKKSTYQESTVFFDNSTSYKSDDFKLAVDPRGRFAIGFMDSSIFLYDLISFESWSVIKTDWPYTKSFIPLAVDISDRFIGVTGLSTVAGNSLFLTPGQVLVVHLISCIANSSTFDVKIHDSWLSNQTLITVAGVSTTSLSMSIVGGVDEKLIVGFPTHNSVHLFSVNESVHLHHINSEKQQNSDNTFMTGYGLSVAWLNKGEKAVVLDQHSGRSNGPSILKLYEMGQKTRRNDGRLTSSLFPNGDQHSPFEHEDFFLQIVATSSNPSELYIYTKRGNVLKLLPSKPGYYSVAFTSDAIKKPFHVLIANSVQCPPRTYKSGNGIWPCSRCEATNNSLESQHNDSVSRTCIQCTAKIYCPGEFLTELELFEDVNQNSAYPESPEIDVFDDIILYTMFRTDCLNMKSPLLVITIALSVALVISILICLMKLFKRFEAGQRRLLMVCRRLDLIGGGELWFGGLISIAILLLVGFASNFSYSYYSQYPIESLALQSEHACHSRSIRNSKFETSLQFLSSPPGEHAEVFGLLNSQLFNLHIEIIHTGYHCGLLTMKYEEKGETLMFSCYQMNGVLYVSVKLPVHSLTIKIMLAGNHTVDALRIGLSAEKVQVNESSAQKLNFSKRFNKTARQLSQNPFVGLDLTKVINITEGLVDSDETEYSGLWLPTFTVDPDQLFPEVKTPDAAAVQTILSISIRETSFFIRNKQEPIARRSEIIFHTILFVGVFIDLIGLTLLLLRLWLIPFIKLFVKKMFPPTTWIYRLFNGNGKMSAEMLSVMEKLTILERKNEVLSARMDALMNHSVDQSNYAFAAHNKVSTQNTLRSRF